MNYYVINHCIKWRFTIQCFIQFISLLFGTDLISYTRIVTDIVAVRQKPLICKFDLFFHNSFYWRLYTLLINKCIQRACPQLASWLTIHGGAWVHNNHTCCHSRSVAFLIFTMNFDWEEPMPTDSINWSERPVTLWGWSWTLWQQCQTGGCCRRCGRYCSAALTFSITLWSNRGAPFRLYTLLFYYLFVFYCSLIFYVIVMSALIFYFYLHLHLYRSFSFILYFYFYFARSIGTKKFFLPGIK